MNQALYESSVKQKHKGACCKWIRIETYCNALPIWCVETNYKLMLVVKRIADRHKYLRLVTVTYWIIYILLFMKLTRIPFRLRIYLISTSKITPV